MLHSIILAGGISKRLWPITSEHTPKQFLRLKNGTNLLQITLDRIKKISDFSVIVSNSKYLHSIKNFTNKADSIILEKESAGTASAITVSALTIYKRSKNSYMAIFPSDHIIHNNDRLIYSLMQAKHSKNISLILSIPKKPNNEYGHAILNYNHSKILKFIEKPDIIPNNGYWNTGIFICKTEIFLQIMSNLNPEIVNSCKMALKNAKHNNKIIQLAEYNHDSISIDHCLMEKCKTIRPILSDMGWQDVGNKTIFMDLI